MYPANTLFSDQSVRPSVYDRLSAKRSSAKNTVLKPIPSNQAPAPPATDCDNNNDNSDTTNAKMISNQTSAPSCGSYAEKLAAATALAESVTVSMRPAALAAAAEAAAAPRIAPINSLRAPRRIILPSSCNKSKRGSLSEQLAAATAGAQEVSAAFRGRDGIGAPNARAGSSATPSSSVLVLPGIAFRVGRLATKESSPVTFSYGCARYCFRSGSKVVDMIMKFVDVGASAQAHGGELRFKVKVDMPAFGSDYVPSNPAHFVSITFPTESAALRARAAMTAASF